MADRPDIRVKPPLVLLAAIITGGILSTFVPMPVTRRGWQRLAGLPLLVGGFLLGGSAVRRMRRMGTNVDPTQPATTLVTSGPYRFSRNPIYLGFTLMFLGLGMLANSLWFLPLSAALMGILQTQVIPFEEGYLENKFGSVYRSYKGQVRRWL